MNKFFRFLSVLSLLMVIVAPHARADDAEEARRRYNEGRAALEAGEFRDAALHFEATSRLRKHGAAPFAAATAWEKAEEPARAADNFHLALQTPGLDNKSKKEAQKKLDTIEQTLGTVVITGPDDLVVQFENSTESFLPARLHTSPGSPVLLVFRGDKTEQREVTVAAGEVIELDVTEPLPEPEPEPEPVQDSVPAYQEDNEPKPVVEVSTSSGNTRKIIGYSAMGVGVASAGIAVFMGFKTLSARDDFEDKRTQQAYDDAKNARLWTNIAWGGAAVLGGVGAALVFWPSSDKKQKADLDDGVSLSATPNGVLLRGSF